MSTTVDERVVSMQFDNKRFESNVKTSMSTLDKLKQSLKFNGATKGLEDVSKAVDSTKNGFGNLEFAGYHSGFQVRDVWLKVASVFEYQIARRIIDAAKNMTKALTIDPVTTGLSEYETQIKAIQTILANTSSKGSTLQDVNSALGELNTYADKTIYNFTEMTKNIGTFTAAGVDLKTSVSAIKGIANLAAVSGSTSEQAANGMYQLSQALSSGTVKLMDWNSVVNAGMGGEVFQNALKETASVHGVNVEKMIKKEGSFRDTLSKGWLTSEILLETLSKFTGDLTKEQLQSMGYAEDQIESILKLGETANSAATDVKTLTQLFDTLKESAQSGWTKTWELLIGDFNEAKEMLGKASNYIGGILGAQAEYRNQLVSGAFSTGWKQLLEQGITNETDYIDSIKELAKESGVATDEVIDGWTDSNSILKSGVVTSDMLSKAVGKLSKKVSEMSGEEQIAAGYTKDNIESLTKLEAGLANNTISMDEFYEKMNRLSGRELIIQAISNSFTSLVNVIKVVKKAFTDIFPPITSEQLYNAIKQIANITERFKMSDETADKLHRTLKGVFAIFDIIGTIILGPIKIAFKLLQSVLGAFNIDILDGTAFLGDFIVRIRDWIDANKPIEKAFAAIGRVIRFAYEKVKEFITSNEELMAFFKSLGKSFNSNLLSIKKWINGIKDAENIPEYIFKGLINGLKHGISGVVKVALNIGTLLINAVKDVLGIHSPSTEFFKIGEYVIQGLVNGVVSGWEWIKNAASTVWKWLKDLFTGSTGDKESKGIFSGLKEKFEQFDWNNLVPIALAAALIVFATKLTRVVGLLTSPINSIVDIIDVFANISRSFKRAVNSATLLMTAEAISKIALAVVMLAAASIALTYVDQKKLWASFGFIAGLVALIAGLTIALGKIKLAPKEMLSLSVLLITLGIMMVSFGKVVKLMAGMTWEEFARGAIGVTLFGGLLIALIAVGKISTKADKPILKIGGTLISLGIALILMAFALKTLGKMDPSTIEAGKTIFVGLSALLGLLIFISGKASNKDMWQISTLMITLGIALTSMAAALFVLGLIPWKNIGRAFVGLGGLLIFLTILIKISKTASGTAIWQVGILMLTLGMALTSMAISLAILGFLPLKNIARGLLAIAGIGAVLSAFIWLSKFITKISKNIWQVGVVMLALGMALTSMAVALAILGFLPLKNIARGLLAIAGIGALLIALLWVSKFVTKVSKNVAKLGLLMLGFSASVAILAGALLLLSFIDGQKLVAPVIALASLMAMLGVVALLAKNTKGSLGPMIAITAAVVALSAALILLSFVDPNKLATATVALLLVMGMFAIVVQSSNKIKSSLSTLIIMTVAIAVIAGALTLLSFMDPVGVLASAVGLSAVLLAMVYSLTILDGVKKISTTSLIAVGVLTLALIGMAFAISLIASMDPVNVLASVLGLSVLLLALVVALNILSGVKKVSASALIALGILTIVVAAIALIIGLLGQAVSGSEALSLAIALSVFLGVMMIAMVALAGLSLIAGPAITGAAALSAVMVILAGGFAAAVAVVWGISHMFPGIGKNLGDMLINAQPFIDGARQIDKSVLDGIERLVKAFGLLTAASFVSGITDFFDTIGGWFGADDSLTKTLKKFANALVTFSDKVSGNIDLDAFNAVGNAMSSMASFQKMDIEAFKKVLNEVVGLNDIVANISKTDYSGASKLSSFIKTIGEFSLISVLNLEVIIYDISKLMDLITKMNSIDLNGVNSFSASLEAAASKSIKAFVEAFDASVKKITDSINNMLVSVSESVSESAYSDFISVGSSIVTGLAAGIDSNTYRATARARAMASAAMQAAKDELGSNSPSEEFKNVGADVPEGFAIGIESLTSKVKDTSKDMAKEALDGTISAIGKIISLVESNEVIEPVIKPILDLSDINAKAPLLGQLLQTNPIGAITNVSAISKGMSGNQNATTTDDIISAMAELTEKLNNKSVNSYTINGITYDDGSNVSKAVEELIRAARIERRV